MDEQYCIINLKAYEEVFNINLEKFMKEFNNCVELAQELNVHLCVCVNSYDLKDAVKMSKGVEIFSQHIDPVEFGKQTGHFPTIAAMRLGAVGTLISHSEHYLSLQETLKRVEYAQSYYINTCVCVRDIQRVEELKQHNIKGLVAFEPPELIGGDISVTTANPHIITQVEEITQNSNLSLLVGAGVKTKEDVEKALELGANGILVASGVVKSSNVEKEVKNLLEGFRIK
ncbi:MAG: triose-phosphate isomerase [Candidatus Nanoarchaeia archaeon]